MNNLHHAPVLQTIYAKAEQRWFDPYDLFRYLVGWIATVGWRVDRAIDWVYDGLVVGVTEGLSRLIGLAHRGSYALYVAWCLAGAVAVIWFLVKAM